MSFIEPDILLCPRCRSDMVAMPVGVKCLPCGYEAREEQGVFNLLPPEMETVKLNEDKVFIQGGEEFAKFSRRPWRFLVGRQHAWTILRFDEEIVDRFPEGRFLEIGGESCVASAIYKSLHPQARVYATDVSPNALRHAAIPASRLFPFRPDVFAAVDGEKMPFKDHSFMAVFALTMIHHLPHPERLLQEVDRILQPGGLFIGIDHCVPAHFRPLFSAAAECRRDQYGIQEDLISYPRWVEIIQDSPLPPDVLHINTNPNYQANPLFALAGKLVNLFPEGWSRHLFPVGIEIIYQKR